MENKKTMNVFEAAKELMAGKKIKKAKWDRAGYIEWDEDTHKFYFKILPPNGYKGEWDWDIEDLVYEDYEFYEEPKPVLDAEEKKYLEGVLRPFKDRIMHIEKCGYYSSKVEYITVYFVDTVRMTFPHFDAGEMYQGMKLDKKYSLKELELFE